MDPKKENYIVDIIFSNISYSFEGILRKIITNYVVNVIGNLLMEYSDSADSENSIISYESFTVIMQAFSQKSKKNSFLSSIIKNILNITENSLFTEKLTEFLKCKNLTIHFHETLYMIGEGRNFKNYINIANITAFSQRYNYENFINILRMDKNSRTKIQNQDIEFIITLFKLYQDNQTDIEIKIFNLDYIENDKVIAPTLDVFLSFLLMPIPDDLRLRQGVKLKKIIEFFNDLKIFFKFIYVAMFKYYKKIMTCLLE